MKDEEYYRLKKQQELKGNLARKELQKRERRQSHIPKGYITIIFMQGEEANEAFEILDWDTEEELLDYLMQWDNQGENEYKTINEYPPWGKFDSIFSWENSLYIISYNRDLNYVALTKKTYDFDEKYF